MSAMTTLNWRSIAHEIFEWLESACNAVGRGVMSMCRMVGTIFFFIGRILKNAITLPFFGGQFAKACINIGFYSLPVVGLTAIFTGMVLALQSYTGFSRFNAESAIANVVALSITRELVPVLAGLMVAGRVGAGIAAEIGTMRVTEQIDAMTTLAVNPFKYLIVPRILAGTLMLPCLVFIGDIIGILGGYLVSVYVLDFNGVRYVTDTLNFLQPNDVISGLVKAAVFGFVVTLMGSYHGYNSQRGAQGVGAATTNAVVSSSILILVLNYLMTQAFF